MSDTLAAEIAALQRRIAILEKEIAHLSDHGYSLEKVGEELDTFRSALVRLEAMQWRPIESAPKDGSTVLLFFAEHDLAYPVINSDFWDIVKSRWWKLGWDEATH